MSHAVSLWIYCEQCGRRMEVGLELTTGCGTYRETFQQPWECPRDDCRRRQRRLPNRMIARALSHYRRGIWESLVDRVQGHWTRIFGEGTRTSARD